MVNIQLLCVGKLKEKHFSAACAEYQKASGGLLQAHCHRAAGGPAAGAPHPHPGGGGAGQGGEALLAKLPKSTKVIALCVEGVQLSSPALAAQLEQWMVEGASHLTLIIGGSFGLHPSVKEAAHLRLSMSPMTFPHHLARVMVLEQVYRAFQIAAGTRYHK